MFARGDKLWLCLWFYNLPLEALLSIRPLTGGATETTTEVHHHRQRLNQEPLIGGVAETALDDQPVAVLEKQRVLLANDAAAALGVKPGQATATARTLAEGIRLLERDRAAEQRCIEQLCCWAYSLSPTLYPCGDSSLLLEIGSCMKLYGSVEALHARIHSQLSRRGYRYSCGLAPTPKAALLFTKPLIIETNETPAEVHHHRRSLAEEVPLADAGGTPAEAHDHRRSLNEEVPGSGAAESLEERLASLPLRLVEEFPREVDALARAGLWTFGDVLALPRRALARRCGKDFVHYLDQLLGIAEDRAPDFTPPPQFSDRYWFGYEVKANQELLPAVQLLLQSLCRFLRNTQMQTQQLQWELYGINRRIQRLAVHSSLSSTNWQEWYQLTGLKIEQLQLGPSAMKGGMGIEGIGLCCEQLVPGNTSTDDLFRQAGQREPLHSLLDRLKNRLGLQSVRKIACRDEHLPEYAGYSGLDTRPAATAAIDREQRPFWLMPEPRQLREVAGQPCWNGRLTLLEGPERIEDNWWDEAVSRDYYVARDKSGQQYWIYRDRLRDHWYIQGVFH